MDELRPAAPAGRAAVSGRRHLPGRPRGRALAGIRGGPPGRAAPGDRPRRRVRGRRGGRHPPDPGARPEPADRLQPRLRRDASRPAGPLAAAGRDRRRRGQDRRDGPGRPRHRRRSSRCSPKPTARPSRSRWGRPAWRPVCWRCATPQLPADVLRAGGRRRHRARARSARRSMLVGLRRAHPEPGDGGGRAARAGPGRRGGAALEPGAPRAGSGSSRRAVPGAGGRQRAGRGRGARRRPTWRPW